MLAREPSMSDREEYSSPSSYESDSLSAVAENDAVMTDGSGSDDDAAPEAVSMGAARSMVQMAERRKEIHLQEEQKKLREKKLRRAEKQRQTAEEKRQKQKKQAENVAKEEEDTAMEFTDSTAALPLDLLEQAEAAEKDVTRGANTHVKFPGELAQEDYDMVDTEESDGDSDDSESVDIAWSRKAHQQDDQSTREIQGIQVAVLPKAKSGLHGEGKSVTTEQLQQLAQLRAFRRSTNIPRKDYSRNEGKHRYLRKMYKAGKLNPANLKDRFYF
ncbi:hypothetical protein IWQ62_006411 [Dispira parvispora]|uniref:Uncharacterized protein n=1 Tax=Dispira parvispora TaxID=1520584 RepID=A0A9W8E044_9FUNG|nr:hypothetical protein IWQ62_006411 [Dispira parvispora]